MEKLTKIQNELKAPKSQYNSFGKYKYRTCEDILESAKPVCLKYNCTLTVPTTIKEVLGIPFVEAIATIKCNETGEVITVPSQAGIDVNKKGMDVAQCFGASTSYAKKYALSGLFLLDDTKESDTTNNHQPQKEKLTTSHAAYKKVIAALSSGKFTIEQVEGKYDISLVKKQLEDASK